jgi:hypothetical protein
LPEIILNLVEGERIEARRSESTRSNSASIFLRTRFNHLDERRPGAFEAFARGVFFASNAKFAADGDFARRVVEHVGRAFGEDAVALRVGIGAEAL